LAAGAILAFAVDYQVSGVEIQTIGLILVVVGIVGLVFSMLFLASFAPFGAHDEGVTRGGHSHDHV
jgi:hypothetical protein